MSRAVVVALIGFTLVGAGCSSDDDPVAGDDVDAGEVGGVGEADDSAGDDEAAGEGGGGEGESDGGVEGAEGGEAGSGSFDESCPAVGTFSGSFGRSADEDLGHLEVSVTDAEIVDVIAGEAFGLYSIYLADHEIDRGPLDAVLAGTISTDDQVEAVEGGVVATVGIGDYTAAVGVSEGDVFDPAEYTLSLLVDSGGGAMTTGGPGEGTAEVLGLDESSVCVSVQFDDGVQQMEGVVNAAIYDGTN